MIEFKLPHFYISKEGSLVVDQDGMGDDTLGLGDLMRQYGMPPVYMSDAYQSAVSIIGEVNEEMAKAIIEMNEERATAVKEEFLKAVQELDPSGTMKVAAATELMDQIQEVAKVNFLSGIRFAIALRDKTLHAVNKDSFSSHRKGTGEEGVSDDPAEPEDRKDVH